MPDRNGYIGRAPGDSAVIIARQKYTSSGVTTDFTFSSGYTVGYIDAYLNGVKLIGGGTDYTASDGSTISLTVAAQDADNLELVAYKAFNVGNVTNAAGDFSVGDELSVVGLTTTQNLHAGVSTVHTAAYVGQGITMYAVNGNQVGVISAGFFYGDGSNLDNAGSSLAAASGSQRVVLTSLTSGTMTSVGTNGDITYNSTTSTLSVPNVSVSGTITQEDLTNVDSVGLVTAGLGFRATKGGLVVTAGVSTFTPYPAIDANEEIQVGTAIQLGKAGVITATKYIGDGSELTGVTSGIEVQSGGSSVGTSLTAVNFASGASITSGSAGFTTITISAAISTEANSPSSGIITIDLSKDDHKVTATGVCTITCTSSGDEGASGTVRITNSGVSTVGFSTYFLWPSGSVQSIPVADGTISLISYTIQRNGAVGLGTQLLSGASLNFS